MSKGLQALFEMRSDLQCITLYEEEQFNNIEKELKALEIIKDKCGFNLLLVVGKLFNEEEYKLLKEVLL